jgi:hypothetical protein
MREVIFASAVTMPPVEFLATSLSNLVTLRTFVPAAIHMQNKLPFVSAFLLSVPSLSWQMVVFHRVLPGNSTGRRSTTRFSAHQRSGRAAAPQLRALPPPPPNYQVRPSTRKCSAWCPRRCDDGLSQPSPHQTG